MRQVEYRRGGHAINIVKPVRGGSRETQQERAEATRAGLIAAARPIFTRDGFHVARASDIVAAASLTRGALYHHFDGKEALFEAVFRDVAADLNRRTAASAASVAGDLWSRIRSAFGEYLEQVAKHEEFRRILLIDGPVVLGWQRWRALQSDFVARGAADALAMLMDEGIVPRRPTEALAHLIQAALNDAALSIAHAADAADPVGVAETFLYLLDRLRD